MAEDIKRKISIFINDREVVDSLAGVGREIGKIKKELKETSDPAERKRLNAELQNTRKRYGEIKNEIEETNVSLDEARGHFSNLVSGLVSGDIKMVQSGLQGIVGNLKGMTKAALAFIATPIGLAITALAGIGLAAKSWFDFNVQVFETNKLVKELTNESGDAVDAIRIRAEVLRDTFEIDLNQSIGNAKSLVNSFGISYDEAFNLIEQSAVRGKTKNEEFFASLKEYPIQFKNAGFSATDFVNIINTGIDLSIYSDKLPDAIKEFTLSITEQTLPAKEALNNAFGEQFTNQLFNNLKSGAITSKDALQLISTEAENIGLNSQQAQLLTADLFKGAGEDAGGALKIFEAINISLNGQQKPLTENQELTAKQLELNKELSGVYTQLFASGNSAFQNLIAKGKILATETLLKILKGGVDVYNWFVDLNNESGVFSAILSTIGNVASSSFKIIGSLLSNAVLGFKGLGNVVEGIFTFDSDKIEEGFKKSLQATVNLSQDVKNTLKDDAKEIYDAFSGKNQAKKINLKDFISDDVSVAPDTTVTIPENETDSELTPEDKKIIASKKKVAEFLDQFDKDQKLKKEIEGLDEATANQLKEELALEAKYLKLQEDAENEKQLLKELEEAKLIELQEIDDKYKNLQLKKEAKLNDEKLKLEEAHNKKQLALKQKLKDDIINGAISLAGQETKIGQALLIAKSVMASKEMLIQLGVLKGKAASAVAEGQIATTVGAANTAKVGFPQNIPLLLAFAAQAVGIISSIKSASKVSNQIKTTGFYYGGNTGDKAVGYDNYGKITGVVHDNEWVAPKIMTQNPKYAANLAYLENERKMLTNGYFNGGTASANNTTSNVAFNNETVTEHQSNTSDSLIVNVLQRAVVVLEKLEVDGVTAYMSNDLRNGKMIKEVIDDYETLRNKNKR